MRNIRKRFLGGIVALMALLWLGQGHDLYADEEDSGFRIPSFKKLRFEEDWSGLRDRDLLKPADPFDRIKHLSPDRERSIWLSLGGQFRTRLEAWRNYGFAASSNDDDEFLLFRFRMHGDLHVGEYLRVFLEGKSSLATERDLPGGRRTVDVDELALQNAFLDFNIPVGEQIRLTLRGGRQELLFGKERLVSPANWLNTRRTFDGVRSILAVGSWSVTGLWVRPVEVRKYDFNKTDNSDRLYGIYASGPLQSVSLRSDFYWLSRGRDRAVFNGTSGVEDRHTIGGRIFGDLGGVGIDFEVEGAVQFGEVGSADISAHMLTAEVGWRSAGAPSNPRLWLGFDMASGDESPGGDVETFDPLFPTGHAHLGYADVVGRLNTMDLRFGVSFVPMDKLSVEFSGHLFWREDTDDALYTPGGGVWFPGSSGDSSQVGKEIDMLMAYRFTRHLTASLGYSHFFAGRFVRQALQNPDDIDFFHLTLAYTF